MRSHPAVAAIRLHRGPQRACERTLTGRVRQPVCPRKRIWLGSQRCSTSIMRQLRLLGRTAWIALVPVALGRKAPRGYRRYGPIAVVSTLTFWHWQDLILSMEAPDHRPFGSGKENGPDGGWATCHPGRGCWPSRKGHHAAQNIGSHDLQEADYCPPEQK